MDIAPIAAVASANAAELTQSQVGLSVLKKAIDIEAAGALALVQAVPVPSAMPSGTVGGVVDTWA
ncbi:MAG: YjfB family protein [Betaproteobacteria bacterium]|nr:YjfB family protein [Betaproteobacteria bacterium]